MKNIVIQPGHINIKFNSIVELRGSTGAPGEQELNQRVADSLSSILRSKGFNVKQTDANANDDKSITEKDWDLFLAVHGDADAAGISGGCVGFPEPSTDGATQESQRIAAILRDSYFPEVGINNVPSKVTNNIKYYYQWKYLSAKTPCVLIEMGEVQDPHDKPIMADTVKISTAIARAICKAFNVPFETPQPQPNPQPQPQVTLEMFEKLTNVVTGLKDKVKDLEDDVTRLQQKNDKLKEVYNG